MLEKTDSRPTRVRVIEKFEQQPEREWTMAELEVELGVWRPTLSTLVSKLVSEGRAPIEKIGHHHWRLEKRHGLLPRFAARRARAQRASGPPTQTTFVVN